MAGTKQLQVRTIGQCCEIYFEGGGELPAILAGKYTSKSVAESAIKLFQLQVQQKVKRPAKKV